MLKQMKRTKQSRPKTENLAARRLP